MVIQLHSEEERRGFRQLLETIFARIVALALLVQALVYWLSLTGLSSVPDVRFDTMPEHWQVATATLATVLPVAALGLWGRFPWGIATWWIAAGIELFMYGLRPDLYGERSPIVIFHVITLSLYLVFRAIDLIMAKKA